MESPVERVDIVGAELWIKRDDLNAPALAGNKVRALEYLLAEDNDRPVLTVGGIGSTHVLATAYHARRLGRTTSAYRWPHHVNAIGQLTHQAIGNTCMEAPVFANVASAFTRATVRRLLRAETWVPFGGTSPRGMLGHISAGLELASQIKRGLMPVPRRVFCPHGTGGTSAGIAVGLKLGGFDLPVVAVRAGPRLGVEQVRLHLLANRALRLLRRLGARVPQLPIAVQVEHGCYGEGYAQPNLEANEAVSAVSKPGLTLDATYSAKACLAAVRWATAFSEPCVLWHTYDGRWMADPTFSG